MVVDVVNMGGWAWSTMLHQDGRLGKGPRELRHDRDASTHRSHGEGAVGIAALNVGRGGTVPSTKARRQGGKSMVNRWLTKSNCGQYGY